MNIVIDKNIPIPLHEQLRKQLTQAIYDGELKVGSKMPTEEELCEKYNISRTVVRQAYTALINSDLCVRERGKGTFVRVPDVVDSLVSTSFNFTEEMLKKGYSPKTKQLSIDIIDYDKEIYSELNLEKNEKVWRLVRIRYVNDAPFIYMENYLPYKYFTDLDKLNFNRVSLYDSLEKEYGMTVVRAGRKVSAVNASKKYAEILGCKANTALMNIENTGYTDSGAIVDYCIEKYEGSKHPLEFEIYKR